MTDQEYDELKRGLTDIARILSVQTSTIHEMLKAMQLIEETLGILHKCMEKIEEKINTPQGPLTH